MVGALTRLLLTVLPTRTVLRTQRKFRAELFNFKNPKAIQICSPHRNYYDYQYHTLWCNPNFPKMGFAKKVDSRSQEFKEAHWNEIDKLPEEFFRNRDIEDYRVPFDYWFPMWKEAVWKRVKTALYTISAILIAFIIPILIIIFNNIGK